jgi:hypothetical protein
VGRQYLSSLTDGEFVTVTTIYSSEFNKLAGALSQHI